MKFCEFGVKYVKCGCQCYSTMILLLYVKLTMVPNESQRQRKNFLAFTRPGMDFGLILMLLNMVEYRSTHFFYQQMSEDQNASQCLTVLL